MTSVDQICSIVFTFAGLVQMDVRTVEVIAACSLHHIRYRQIKIIINVMITGNIKERKMKQDIYVIKLLFAMQTHKNSSQRSDL